MPEQQEMTAAAATVFNVLPARRWVNVEDIVQTTGLSLAQCQLILTQLELAHLAENKAGEGKAFKRRLSASRRAG